MDPAVLGTMIPIVAIIGGCAVAIFRPMAAAYARQLDRQSPVTPEMTARLERMEQSIEAIALEIERISEGQRFTTKLLAERHTALPAHIGEGNLPSERRT